MVDENKAKEIVHIIIAALADGVTSRDELMRATNLERHQVNYYLRRLYRAYNVQNLGCLIQVLTPEMPTGAHQPDGLHRQKFPSHDCFTLDKDLPTSTAASSLLQILGYPYCMSLIIDLIREAHNYEKMLNQLTQQ